MLKYLKPHLQLPGDMHDQNPSFRACTLTLFSEFYSFFPLKTEYCHLEMHLREKLLEHFPWPNHDVYCFCKVENIFKITLEGNLIMCALPVTANLATCKSNCLCYG